MKIKAILLTLLAVVGIYTASLATRVQAQPIRRYVVVYRCGTRPGFWGHRRRVFVRARRRDHAVRRAHRIMRDRCGHRPFRVIAVRRD